MTVIATVLLISRTVKPRKPTWPWMAKAKYEYTVFMKVNANKIIILPEKYFLFINVYQVYTWYYLVILGTRAYHTHDVPISICLSQNFSLWYRVTFLSTLAIYHSYNYIQFNPTTSKNIDGCTVGHYMDQYWNKSIFNPIHQIRIFHLHLKHHDSTSKTILLPGRNIQTKTE